MKPTVTIVFTILFLVVLGVYFFLERSTVSKSLVGVKIAKPAGVATKSQEVSPMQLLPVDKDDRITTIQIQNLEKGENVTLKRGKQGWEIAYPVLYPADTLIVEGLVTVLTLSNKARRLMPEKDWWEYGLEKPSMKIGVETEHEKNRLYLYLGDPTPVGDFVFARWEHEKEYFLLNANFKKVFNRSLYSLRMKRIFRIPFPDLAKIHIRTTAGDYEIAHHEDKWFWMEPIQILGERLAKERVDELFAKIKDLYIKDFLDDEARSKRELGISLLGTSVALWGKEMESQMLYLGNEVGTRDSYYGMLEGEGGFFLVARPNIRLLFETIETMAQESGEMRFVGVGTV